MLARSTSSRRRRASRSAASSPQTRGVLAATPAGRRASIAVSPAEPDHLRARLAPDPARSPRHSLAPDPADGQPLKDLGKPDRGAPRLAPDFDRSPRNSLVPESQKSPRHSLVPGDYREYPLSPRNGVPTPEYNRSPRNSLAPGHDRSPRHSLTPESGAYASKLSVSGEFNRSPRNSLVPESVRSSRRSLSETPPWRPEDQGLRGHRHLVEAPKKLHEHGSEEIEPRENRSPRGSLARTNVEECDRRSPRGSLTLTFQEPLAVERRASTDNAGARARSSSPYRSRSTAGYSGGYGYAENGSRRASSSVSQVSGDEQRRLCVDHNNTDAQSVNLALTLTTYGSVAYQLKDANLEASGTCDFVCKALDIVNKTAIVTITLVCLAILPILMLIMGIQFLRDCPREPNIPIYMIVGGSVGSVKMALTLWSQFHQRPPNSGVRDATTTVSKIASCSLTALLLGWFSLGNYWIFNVLWPDYAPTLFEPNKWCHKTLYVFALVHLGVVYALLGAVAALVVALAACQLFGCAWLGPARYK
ncbi:unnamed protein product [Phyllotreta striolata]|uniref:Uncharacterized protein n=1 Tax=Phyllotreta striolata TaxID=444603 RepID=A0A9N9TV68_PHYSR|nr:unnamed protein product [Phyllotreta striolata]